MLFFCIGFGVVVCIELFTKITRIGDEDED